ncbi:cysteine desulfurase [Candidatus Scalindua japonica]|uniref:cysteine desulfurase n=2 Tax=Candidatus Scalindua japonica TaxID=1284222 RepID=A0A286U3G8_9BACT|nr:cysteine desulfurase [Candidatus Scalindua japonica]
MNILNFAYDYYEKNRVGPLYQKIKKNTGATKEAIEELFPHGLASVYTWVGIPIQTGRDLCKPMATVNVENFREVYLDNNATTFIRDEVRKNLVEYYSGSSGFGNPSSSTNPGILSYDIIRNSRIQISDCLKVNPEEIIFTGSGSEANNAAIKGIAFKHLDNKGHIISSKVEHPAVLKTLEYLEDLGFSVTYLNVSKDGRVTAQSVKNNLRTDTILVSIMAINNEIGVINPISEIGKSCKEAGVPFMVDAIQGFGKITLLPKKMGLSLMTMSGHKIYAPKGVGALYVSKEISVVPLIHGGAQEYGLRAGTENVGAIMAFGQAARLACSEMEKENRRLLELRNYFLEGLRKIEPGIIVNGSLEHRTANNLNIGFPDVDSGSLLLSLNQIGVYVSSGSACSAGSTDASYTIKALGVDTDRYGIIRFSFGLSSTKEDVEYMFEYLPSILKQLKAESAGE